MEGTKIHKTYTQGLYSQIMNAESALVGAMPGSNQIKQTESALVALKTDKIMEIISAGG